MVLKGEHTAACKVLVGELGWNRPFGRSALRSDYSITMSLKKFDQKAQIGLNSPRIGTSI